jgi:hypothetical protein
MKYMKFVMAAIVAAVLLTTTTFAATDPAPVKLTAPASDLGQWTLSLSGVGASALNGSKLNNSTVGGEFELGHSGKFILPLDAGVRQGVGYSDANGSSWQLSTHVFSDWRVVKLGNLELGAGGNVGLSYANQPLKWEASPEVVTRLYLKRDVDLFGRVEYPFDLNAGRSENSLRYTLGIRVRF